MGRVMILAIVALLAAAALTTSAPAASTRATCSDVAYLNGAIKSTKKMVTAWGFAKHRRYYAALHAAQTALWFSKHSAQPCDEGTEDYWLHRQYLIRYDVATVRYMEEMLQGDSVSADSYLSTLNFWNDQMKDIQLTW